MDVAISQPQTTIVVDTILRAALGSANVGGISTGPYGTIAHIVNSAHQAITETILAAIGTRTILADKTTITADNVDKATLTMDTADASLDWLLIENGVLLGQGTETAVTGVVTLEFATDDPGTYEIWIHRKQGNYASGKIIIIAS